MTSRFQARLLAQRALFQRLQSSKKRTKLQAAFTLVELLIVVIILGILAALAIPAFLNQQGKAEAKAADSTVISTARACAALQITNEQSQFDPPPGVNPTTCSAAGTVQTYTTINTFYPRLATQATATIFSSGEVSLTTPAVPN